MATVLQDTRPRRRAPENEEARLLALLDDGRPARAAPRTRWRSADGVVGVWSSE